MFLHKYLKYKQKYFKLKKIQKGGKVTCDKGYQNIFGTCWAISTQMILTFGDATSNNLETVMKSFKVDDQYINIIESKKCFIEKQIQKVKSNDQLYKFFPDCFLNNEKIDNIKIILDKFIDRYYSKVFEIKNLEKLEYIDKKQNPLRCELVISNNFKNLFYNYNYNYKHHGGNIINEYLFMNLLSIFFLNQKASFKIYYEKFNEINFNKEEDLGILIKTDDHMCSLYSCNNTLIYYNDNDESVHELDWICLLKKLETNNLYIENGHPLRSINIECYNIENKEKLSKVRYLIVISKHTKDNSFDIDIKNILNNNFNDITDSQLQFIMANRFYNGEGVEKNSKEALRLFHLAVAQGNPSAQYRLGTIYNNGLNNGLTIAPDKAEAVRLYLLAATQGHIEAQYRLGEMFDDGEGVAPCKAEAIRWYRLAAGQGNAAAQFNLGYMLSKGDGVAQDKSEAVRLFRLSAEHKNAHAQYTLGILLWKGKDGIAQDKNKAIRLFQLAATQGHAEAQNYLGYLFEYGIIVEGTKELAMKMYSLAATQGHKGAQINLKKLQDSMKI